MTTSRNLLCKRLRAIGISKHNSHRMVNDVLKWESRSGPEWTVTRLKDAKAYYLSKLAGKSPEMKTWWASKGKGAQASFTSLWLNLPQDTEEQLVRAIRACNAYSLFKKDSLEPTEKQASKFFTSVEQDRHSVRSLVDAGDILKRLSSLSRGQRVQYLTLALEKGKVPNVKVREVSSDLPKGKIRTPRKFWELAFSGSRKAPSAGLSPADLETNFRWVVDNMTSPPVMGLLYKYKGLSSMSGFTQVRNQIPGNLLQKSVVGGGNIAYIQEEGYKLRAVANPFRVHQVVLNSFKEQCLDYLRRLPTDCTHDQGRGQLWAQSKLAEGRTLHAVDLSDATNNIPLELQVMAVVTQLQLDLYDKTTFDTLMYFMEVSRSAWKVPGKDQPCRWTWGQPMGLGPSFPVFAMWHNYILRIAHHKANSKFAWDDSYRIVGDDVVIACDDTHKLYRQYLANWQIPVSESKCISSNKCTEFVGKVITPTNSYAIPKFKALSDSNFLDVLKQVGPSALSWCKPRQRLVAKILSQVPEEYGGLGWNPSGRPLEQRVELAVLLGLLDNPTEDTPSRRVSQRASAILNKVAYSHRVPIVLDALARFGQEKGSRPSPTRARVLVSDIKSAQAALEGDPDNLFLRTVLEDLLIEQDANPILSSSSLYSSGAPLSTGDPRGTSMLLSMESRLKGRLDSGESSCWEFPEVAVELAKLDQSSRMRDPTQRSQDTEQSSHPSVRDRKSVV